MDNADALEKHSGSVSVRAHIIKVADAGQDSHAIEVEDTAFNGTHALTPPYDPEILMDLFRNSDALRPNVDSYMTNIDSFGHRFEPIIDLESDDAEDAIRVSMILGRERQAAEEGEDIPEDESPPTDDEVEERIEEIRQAMLIERARAEAWFENCVQDHSFVELRRRTRMDLEITGNAYWEVLRNGDGEIAEFVYLPSFTMRLRPRDLERTTVSVKQRTPDLGITSTEKRKRFRSFVQSHNGHIVYFKEFKDPRIRSALTGAVYKNETQMQRAEGDRDVKVPQATEVIHFKIHFPAYAYGMARWIGASLSVLGNKKAGEVNVAYFDNKSIPPLAILVSGGKLNDNSVTRIESYVEEELKGAQNFHKILILEAEGEGMAGFNDQSMGKMRIELKPLTEAMQQDALFLNYGERNMDIVGMSFRNPRLLRGDIRDFNRATSEAALDFTEAQVYAPERNEFDYMIDRQVLPDLQIKLWRFKSNGPIRANPRELAEMIKQLSDVLPVGVALDIAEGVFGRNFSDVTADWAKRPLKLTLMGLNKGLLELDDVETDAEPGEPEGEGVEEGGEGQGELTDEELAAHLPKKRKPYSKLKREVKRLIRLRAALKSRMGQEYEREFMKALERDSATNDQP